MRLSFAAICAARELVPVSADGASGASAAQAVVKASATTAGQPAAAAGRPRV
jgi:hypothetical protein